MKLTQCAKVKKSQCNPLIQPSMIPFESTLTYNAGITKFQGRYVMLFRNDYGYTREDALAFRQGARAWPAGRINLGLAVSSDGINWRIKPEPVLPIPLTEEIVRVYDPRLTVIEDRCYLCFAADTQHGIRGGIAVTDDLDKFELLSLSVPDNRNMVLFPEKINGKFVRLERPFPIYGRGAPEAFDMWISDSPDCKYWGNSRLLLGSEQVPFSNCKIGPAAPPVKTRAGWLTTFHAVWKHTDKELLSWHGGWNKEYFGGLMLLDLNDPSKIIGIYDKPLLVPEEDYEIDGMRGRVIFPGGMILEDSGEVKIYYGAADTVECLATADVNDLLELCGVHAPGTSGCRTQPVQERELATV